MLYAFDSRAAAAIDNTRPGDAPGPLDAEQPYWAAWAIPVVPIMAGPVPVAGERVVPVYPHVMLTPQECLIPDAGILIHRDDGRSNVTPEDIIERLHEGAGPFPLRPPIDQPSWAQLWIYEVRWVQRMRLHDLEVGMIREMGVYIPANVEELAREEDTSVLAWTKAKMARTWDKMLGNYDAGSWDDNPQLYVARMKRLT